MWWVGLRTGLDCCGVFGVCRFEGSIRFVYKFTNCCNTNSFGERRIVSRVNRHVTRHKPSDGKDFISSCMTLNFHHLDVVSLRNKSRPVRDTSNGRIVVFGKRVCGCRRVHGRLVRGRKYRFRAGSSARIVLRKCGACNRGVTSVLHKVFTFMVCSGRARGLFKTESCFKVGPFCCTRVGKDLLFNSRVGSFLTRPRFRGRIGGSTLGVCLVFRCAPLLRAVFGNMFGLRPKACFACSKGRLGGAGCFSPACTGGSHDFSRAMGLVNRAVRSSISCRRVTSMRMKSFLSNNISSDCVTSAMGPVGACSMKFRINKFSRAAFSGSLYSVLRVDGTGGRVSSSRFFSTLPRIRCRSSRPRTGLSTMPLCCLSRLTTGSMGMILDKRNTSRVFNKCRACVPDGSNSVCHGVMPTSVHGGLKS